LISRTLAFCRPMLRWVAVGDHRDIAEAELERRYRVLDVEHKRRAADDRAVDKGGRNPEIFGEVERRGTALGTRADQPVDIL
jgi:hypothetical protein